MSVSMYQMTVPAFSHNLKNTAAMLKKAAAWAKAKNVEPEVLLQARLAPDMLPLRRQVQILTDNAKACCGRLTNEKPPVFADGDDDFAQLQQRIKDTLTFLRSLKKEQFDGSETRDIDIELPIGVLSFTGLNYVNGWALPNFYFHCTTTYSILRHNGVELGKADFLGKVPGMSASGKIAKMMGLPSKKKSARKKAPARKKTRG